MKVHVGNLNYDTKPWALKQFIEQFYNTKEVTISYAKKGSQRSRGFGCVEFFTQEDAEAAMEFFEDQLLDGRKITLRIYEERG